VVEIVTGSIFDATEKYICHQCNCVTKKAAHLSKDMFQHFPFADVYTGRATPNEPGTISVKGNGIDQRYVINIFGQFYPGYPKEALGDLDGYDARAKYFYHGLLRIAKIPNLESIAFPWKVGCGAADGDWEVYQGNIENFAKYVEQSQGAKVVIYRREGDK